MSEETGTGLTPRPNADAQLEMWSEMLAVERERIASKDRAVEAMREGFTKLDAVDERQFQFHSDRLHRDDEYRNRQLGHTIQVTWAVLGVVAAALGLVLIMAFWGGEEQRSLAISLMTHALSVGGSLAVGFFLGRRSRG